MITKIRNADWKLGTRTTISTTISTTNSRSRIDQDEFEIQGTWLEKSNFEKSKGSTTFEKSNRARHRKSKFEKSNRATKRKFRRQIRHENSRNLNSKFESKIEIREIEWSNEIREIEWSNEIREIESKSRFEKSNRATKRKSRTQNSTRKLRNLARSATQPKKLHDERQTNDEKLTHTKRAHARTKQRQNAHQKHTLQMSGCFNKIKYLLFLINKNNTSKTRVYLVYNACNFLCIMNSYTSSLLN